MIVLRSEVNEVNEVNEVDEIDGVLSHLIAV